MTPAFAALRDIAVGRTPADNALLQNCRLEGFGTRAFGREPILDLFRRAPIDLSDTKEALESPCAILAMQGDRAIYADVCDGRVARLWVLGPEALDAPESAVSVPHDLDLSQFEADVMFDYIDHPDLDRSDAARLTELAHPNRMSGAGLPEFSRRSFVVRAFSATGQTAALIVCAGAHDAVRRKPISVNIALTAGASNSDDEGGVRLIIDHAGLSRCVERNWTPRL